jgi:hypothetical protein
MSELYTLKEAYDLANGDDVIKHFSWGDGQDCMTKNAINEIRNTVDVLQALSKEWIIIPADPKVLTYHDYFLKWKGKPLPEDVFNAAHQNGRLERDLELRAIVDFVVKNIDFLDAWDSAQDIIEAARNLKPLNPE